MTNQVNEVLEKIRFLCDLKENPAMCDCGHSMFRHNWHLDPGSPVQHFDDCHHCVCKKYGEIIGLPVQLNHLLWALERKAEHGLSMRVDVDMNLCFFNSLPTDCEAVTASYNLQKSVEDNLRSNPELTKWVHGVIIGK